MRPSFAARFAVLVLASLAASPAIAIIRPVEPSALQQKAFRLPGLEGATDYRRLSQVSGELAARLGSDLAALGVPASAGVYDLHTGRWVTLIPSRPLVPGSGVGNNLRWRDLGRAEPGSTAEIQGAAWSAFAGFLTRHSNELRIALDELEPRVTVHDGDRVIQIVARRIYHGLEVRDTYVTAVINSGNLVLLGARNWGDLAISTTPTLDGSAALARLWTYLGVVSSEPPWRKTSLAIVPFAGTPAAGQATTVGYRLVWVLSPRFRNDHGSWEALVDAHTGELLAFEDTNHYATARKVVGGVLPITNDEQAPDGVEQASWPTPFADVTDALGNRYVTDSGGNLPICLDGNITTHLDSQFVRILDQCIPTGGTTTVSNVGSDNIDLGTAPPFGTDCTPSSNPALGNTRASRTGFYEVNRIIEQAKGHLPDNLWLQDQLTANMNIPDVCNAFWNGSTINFYRNAGACTNSGEIAAIFDHEWGHGMDNFDANGVIARPGQEGIADVYMFARLNTSCVGRNFSTALGCNSPARGYGDPCNNDCDGVRDIDYHNRTSQAPHGMAFLLSNCGAPVRPTCGGSVHCVGAAVSEAIFDMARRDLRCHGVPGGWVDTPLHNGPVEGGQCAGGAPPTIDVQTAYELATRLFYLGAGPVGRWFECRTDGTAGCIADGGYLNQLAADDDNGNLTDGTPHMKAIHAAYDRRDIDCAAFPVVQNSGCGGAPTAAPIVTATPLDRAVRLTWSTVPNALSYDVFRTEGVFQCDFGKTRIGQVQAGDCAGGNCEFLAEELQNDFEYYFTVLPLGGSNGPANTCTGVMSACTTATPVSGSNLSVNESSAALTMLSGDGDIFLDNCENARVEFPVFNIGSATQTNVRIVGVEPTSHPGMTVTTSFPAPVAATLASCATASGSFDFTAFGAAFQDDVEFVVELTSDQLAAQGVTRKFTLRFPGIAEGDFQPQASKVFDFESNLESWQVVLGTFNRTTANPPGGAGGSAAFVASSSNLPSQCDQIRSPLVRLTATSTLSLSNQFETEGDGGTGTWYDRANVGIVDYSSGDRTVVSPDGGRAYNVPNGAANGTCDTQGQPGWAGTHAGFGTAAGWAASNFSATALGSAAIAGDVVRIGINYGTDSGTHLRGFWFDRAQLTNFELHVPDAQSCGVNLAPDAVDDAASTLRNTPVAVAVLANDSDPEGDTLAITAVQSPTAQGGTATVNANGTPGNTGDDFIDYSPPSGFLSPPDDTFTYSIGDGHGHFDTATVRITVSSRNNPPDAVDDSASTPQNTPVAIDVLANDTDPDGDALAITSVQSPTARGGTAAIDDNGTASNTADDFIRYTPPAGFFSPPPDSFIYTISDGRDSANATVTVTVEAPCPPQPTGSFSDNIETVVAGYQTQSTRTDPPPSSWRRFSPDSSASSASTVWQALDDQPGNPTLTPIDHRLVLPPLDLSATSQLSFKHNFDFARFPAATLATSFQSGSAIEISADGGTNWVDIGNFITTGGYNGVVDADASANTNPLRGRPAWVGTSNPATPGDPRIGPNGRLEAMTANPVQVNLGAAIQTLFSTPHLLNALIRFRLGGTFQALGGGIQGTGWGIDDVAVTGLLEEANCPPVAEDDSASTPRNTPVTVNVVTNDSDPNGDPLTVTSVTDPPHGSAVNNGNGTVTYTPDSGFVGNDSFGYTVCDDGTPPLCDTATVAVTVTAPLLPDLVVSNITVNNNRNVREGDKVTIRATVSNTGNASAQASTTEFRLDNTTILGSVATPSIPAGGSQQVSVQWDTRSQKGPHTIRVTADAGQTVTESSETNNSSTLNITVQGNKVKNASFEQGGGSSQGASSMSASVPGPAAWSGSSTGAGSTTWSDGGSDGAKSAGATGNGGNAATSGSPSWTSDAIVVTPGEALSFLVSVSSANASSAPTAGLVYLGAAGNVLQTVNLITAPLTTAGFAKLEQPVTIPPGVAQVRVKLVGFAPTDLRTSGTVRFDEVGLFGD